MTKHLLAGVAAVVLMSGVALAQTYPPAPPPPPGTTNARCSARTRSRLQNFDDNHC
jgi:hypothetical protein